MLKQIKIKNLFGYYNYNIELKGNVTIIHGPNGCGKTTILKMIHYLFGNKLTQLNYIEFDEMQVVLNDGRQLTVAKQITSASQKSEALLYEEQRGGKRRKKNYFMNYELITTSGEVIKTSSKDAVLEIINDYSDRLPRGRWNRIIPFIDQISDSEWVDVRVNHTMSTEEFIENYYDVIIDNFPPKRRSEIEVPKDIRVFLESIDIQFITADRLKVEKREKPNSYSDETTTIESRVSVCASGIADKIKTALQEYATFSQTKDRSFPLRVIEGGDILSIEQIKAKFINLEERRKHYIEIGLLNQEDRDISTEQLVASITEVTRQILSLYARDTEEKLDVIDNISMLISLYKNLLEKKFSNKEILFSKEKGFEFKLAKTGRHLEATSLSSGEQQELVLLYDLIFNTTAKTLVLIDEPELSLHIKWQLEFVGDLLEIINKRGFKSIIATHSPQIIDDRWDLTVSLAD